LTTAKVPTATALVVAVTVDVSVLVVAKVEPVAPETVVAETSVLSAGAWKVTW
jgi:hypothetical protein